MLIKNEIKKVKLSTAWRHLYGLILKVRKSLKADPNNKTLSNEKHSGFTILCPSYRRSSAGVSCLWRLGNYLVELGHEVYFINYEANPAPKPEWSLMQEITDFVSKGVVIAPEVFEAIDFPHVRWCLNKPGLLGGPSSYSAGTKVFHFHPDLEESAKAASCDSTSLLFVIGTVDLPVLEPIKKEYICWYQGKYAGVIELKNHEYELQITASWPQDKIQYWELLNKTKIIKTYDNFTSVACDAVLMGCEVLCWDGQDFVPFKPSEDVRQYVINKDRDLEAVKRFTEQLVGN